MLPTYQRLGSRQTAGAIHLRLKEETKLAIAKRLPQFSLQRGTGGHRFLHLQIEETERVAAPCLASVHREICPLQHTVGRLRVFAKQGDAGTSRNVT